MYCLLSEERPEDPEKILTSRDVIWSGIYDLNVGQKRPRVQPGNVNPFALPHNIKDLYVSGAETSKDWVSMVQGPNGVPQLYDETLPGVYCPACRGRSCRGKGHCNMWDELLDVQGRPMEPGDWYKQWGPYDTMNPVNSRVKNCMMSYAPCSVVSKVKDYQISQGSYPFSKKNVKSIDERYLALENNAKEHAVDVGISLSQTQPAPILFRLEPGRRADLGVNPYGYPPQFIWLYDPETGRVLNAPAHVIKYPINSISINRGVSGLWWMKDYHLPGV